MDWFNHTLYWWWLKILRVSDSSHQQYIGPHIFSLPEKTLTILRSQLQAHLSGSVLILPIAFLGFDEWYITWKGFRFFTAQKGFTPPWKVTWLAGKTLWWFVDTSSNRCCSIVMLVFGCVYSSKHHHPAPVVVSVQDGPDYDRYKWSETGPLKMTEK